MRVAAKERHPQWLMILKNKFAPLALCVELLILTSVTATSNSLYGILTTIFRVRPPSITIGCAAVSDT
jgi:hypothetical protein